MNLICVILNLYLKLKSHEYSRKNMYLICFKLIINAAMPSENSFIYHYSNIKGIKASEINS